MADDWSAADAWDKHLPEELLPVLGSRLQEAAAENTQLQAGKSPAVLSLNNAGRWGATDELGTRNFITPLVTSAAAKLVRTGEAVTLSREINFNDGAPLEPSPAWPATRLMLETGEGRAKSGDDSTADGGPVRGARRNVKEQIAMVFHGRSVTHIDSPGHFSLSGFMYNGFRSDLVNSAHGCERLSVAPLGARAGFQTRGVLLDVHSLHKLEAGEALRRPVRLRDLLDCEQKAGVSVRPGDAVFVRTGYEPGQKDVSPGPNEVDVPALHPECLWFLQERSVALLGSDTPNDVSPPLFSDMRYPIHIGALVFMGLWLCDNVALNDVAEACQRHSRWEFFLSLSPLKLSGVSGSPVNPVALF
jgi:kynurenine formamidase